jgi:hypothetical protein
MGSLLTDTRHAFRVFMNAPAFAARRHAIRIASIAR